MQRNVGLEDSTDVKRKQLINKCIILLRIYLCLCLLLDNDNGQLDDVEDIPSFCRGRLHHSRTTDVSHDVTATPYLVQSPAA
jgi:hypothetical protein